MSSHRFFLMPAELIPYTRMTHLMISKYHSCLLILFINRCAPSNPLGRNSFSRRGRPPCLPVVFVIHLPLFAVVVIHLPCVRLLRRADTGVCPNVWMRLLGGQTQGSAPTVGCGCWTGRHGSLPLHVDPFVCLFHCFHSSISLLSCFQSNTPVVREN